MKIGAAMHDRGTGEGGWQQPVQSFCLLWVQKLTLNNNLFKGIDSRKVKAVCFLIYLKSVN